MAHGRITIDVSFEDPEEARDLAELLDVYLELLMAEHAPAVAVHPDGFKLEDLTPVVPRRRCQLKAG